MDAFPHRRYVLGTRVWQSGSTEVTLLPGPGLEYGDLVILLAGTVLFFRRWEFVECDVWFRRVGGGVEETGMERGALELNSLGSARVRNV